MAMPTSGNLYLYNPAFSGQCRSIAHAVYGANPPLPASLEDVALEAGIYHCNPDVRHSYFYGFVPPQTNVIYLQTFYETGDTFCQVLHSKCSCVILNPPIELTQSVNLRICLITCRTCLNSSLGTGRFCVIACRSVKEGNDSFCCVISANSCIPTCCTAFVDVIQTPNNNPIHIITHSQTICGLYGCSFGSICINTQCNMSYSIGTPSGVTTSIAP